MTTIPSSAISRMGMQAAAKQQKASAHNVSNLNTDGFQAVEVVQQSEESGGVTTEVRETGAPNPLLLRDGQLVAGSNTDLVRETINQVAALASYRANAAAFRAADEMTDELLDTLA